MWAVEVAEYMGEDYWADYPPFLFGTEREAKDFADRQGHGENANTKVRRVYEMGEK